MKYFDPLNNKLIFIEKKADPVFWDHHWKINNIRNDILGIKNTFVSRITKKFLKPSDGYILEGGCGTGVNVASLFNNGYKVIGVDYAENTVRTLNKYIPELDIRIGDVRKLQFGSDYFVGYWSLGVIEHFWEGYEQIAEEMFRVILKNGFLFLMFPYMSPLRRLKGRMNIYDRWHNGLTTDFYQFSLNSKIVINDFTKMGFRLLKAIPFDGIKGTKDEVDFLRTVLQKLYNYNSSSLILRGFRKAISTILSTFAGHCMLLIFHKSSV